MNTFEIMNFKVEISSPVDYFLFSLITAIYFNENK